MNTMKRIAVAAALAVVVTAFVSVVKADEADWSTWVTIDRPMEVSDVVLGPGTYLFQLASYTTSHDLVLIYSEDKSHLYGMFRGVPAYRVTVSEESKFSFLEREQGSPQALSTWFYPANNNGIEFIYRHAKTATAANPADSPIAMARVVR